MGPNPIRAIALAFVALLAIGAAVVVPLRLFQPADRTPRDGDRRPPVANPDPTLPAWFRTMDRDGDGAVSRAEFTGTAEAFALLDADQNGVISAAEARAGDEAFRPQTAAAPIPTPAP